VITPAPALNLLEDDLRRLQGPAPAFVGLGEVMMRDMPADRERPERTRLVQLSPAGSEFSVSIGLARLGVASAFVTRLPANPYGHAVRNVAREHGVGASHFVWAPATDPIGRMIFEPGCTPRPDTVVYQRKHSAASLLDAGMVEWPGVLAGARLFHTSGITFGLAAHSGHPRNYNLAAFEEAVDHLPGDCRVGLDFNYRRTLWPVDAARETLGRVLEEHVHILITSVQDMARFFDLGCARFSARALLETSPALEDEDLQALASAVLSRFDLEVVALTLRQVDSLEHHRWESAAASRDGAFFRSPAARPVSVADRLGGGDAWTAGFYYGLLTGGWTSAGLVKGVLVGDAAARLKQTFMFDIPVLDRREVEALLEADLAGGATHPVR
jgi:2-dehydro-3-deoxygluconokinase